MEYVNVALVIIWIQIIFVKPVLKIVINVRIVLPIAHHVMGLMFN